MEPPREVVAYYERFAEELRLDRGPFQLEFARTKDILGRLLPSRPARVVDVGGAAGAYSAWLADQDHEVHLVDASPRLVEEARKRNAALPKPIASLAVADARSLPQAGKAADVVLYDVMRLEYAGALHDPIAALLFCGTGGRVQTAFVNGRKRVNNGRLLAVDENELSRNANRLAQALAERAQVRTQSEAAE